MTTDNEGTRHKRWVFVLRAVRRAEFEQMSQEMGWRVDRSGARAGGDPRSGLHIVQ